MSYYSANPLQTPEWETACLKTRRNLKSRKKRLDQFKIRKSDIVLDLGCGDGLNITLLHKMGVKNISGVDISPELVALARKNNTKTKFKIGSAQKIPFKANEFDVVLVDSVFHHLMEYSGAASEIKRVLKPKGRLCFVEPHNSPIRGLLDFVSVIPGSEHLPFIGNRAAAYREEIDLMTHWLNTESEFIETLVKNGFKEEFKRVDFLSIIASYKKV